MRYLNFLLLQIFLLLWIQSCTRTTPIEKIQSLDLPGIVISDVRQIPAGAYTPEGQQQTYSGLPDFVKVVLSAHPVEGSDIRIEVWLPEKGWNGRFLGTGNGGGAGRISYGALASGLKKGFAVANTDMGTSPAADLLIGQPERWEDFGHRATHEMTVAAKIITEKYYGKAPGYSYFVGCSTGGQQSLMTAQRYPGDYDGIIAGAPANNRTHLHVGFLWIYKVTNGSPGRTFSDEQIQAITQAVLAANAGKDGGHPDDNFLTDPRLARFDPETMAGILTSDQIDALKKIYQGPVNPVTGERIYTPIPLGSESDPTGIARQQSRGIFNSLLYQFKWIWGKDFDVDMFDFDKDMAKMDAALASILNANNPDLEPFRKSGGKLLMYGGTVDPLVPFQDAVNYYDRVVDAQGGLEQTQSFFRYFIASGMAHCSGGPGLNDFGQNMSGNVPADREHDLLIALMDWVEKGIAPEKMIASAYIDGKSQNGIRFQRPVFPYPMFPHYTEGDPNLPSSYRGVVHERGLVVQPPEKYLK